MIFTYYRRNGKTYRACESCADEYALGMSEPFVPYFDTCDWCGMQH